MKSPQPTTIQELREMATRAACRAAYYAVDGKHAAAEADAELARRLYEAARKREKAQEHAAILETLRARREARA